MSTYRSSGKTWLRGLTITLFVTISLLTAVALVLGLYLNKRTELAVLPEDNVQTEQIDSSALLNASGWNSAVAMKLYNSLANAGDNVALGNAGGVISSRVISLGGYNWSVVYKQNGIVTLYASEPVAYLNFDNASVSYVNSAVREYLNGEFYSKLVENVGFSGFEDMIASYGSSELYYQLDGAQAVPLQTVAGDEISNCDGVANDKIWLPSAYEVGGFAVTKTSPQARVNSFKTINSNNLKVNSGLWNLSNTTRLAVDNAVLRSTAGDGIGVVQNGLVTSGNVSQTYAIRPCLNIVMPSVVGGVLLQANDSTYQNNALLAAGDGLIASLQAYADVSGTVYTAKSTGTTTFSGATYTNSQMFLHKLASIVNLGANLSGYTFKLSCDVDMSVFTVWNPIGRSNVEFAGVFDGQGYKISGLCSSSSGSVGLFGHVSGSGAIVKNVAVVDSSWYTTSSYVGGITGLLGAGAKIEQCYSECGISGKNYVGGLVGQSTDSSTITNCYNKSGVAGIGYVGGIIGSNGGTTITCCYNVGAVTADNATVGGIVGQNSSGSVTNCVYNGANVPVSISQGTESAYANMQGQKTSSGTTAPTSMSSWAFEGSPWMISTTENDRLPMLKVFLKNITINVRAGDSLNKVSINGGTYASTATYTTIFSDSTTITVKAQASFTGTDHYKLSSWNLFKESVGDSIIETDIAYASAGTAETSGNYKIFTLTLTANDSYNLEAVFEKLYAFTVSPVFNGFNDGTTCTESEFKCEMSTTAFDSKWYPAGTTATLTIGSPNNRYWTFAGLKGSNNGSTWETISDTTFLTTTTANAVYVATVGAGSPYVGSDTYIVQPNFDRYYNVTLQNSIPSIGSGATKPSITTQMEISSPSAAKTATDSATASSTMQYSGSINASITSTGYTSAYTFTKWELLNGADVVKSATTASATLSSIGNLTDTVKDLVLKASFSANSVTITAKELVGSTENSSAGIVVLSASSDLTSVSTETKTLTVTYGTPVYVYILPSYSTGYQLSTFNGSSVSTLADSTTGLYKASIASATATQTYNVVYALATDFVVNLSATVDGASSSLITFNPTGYSNADINQALSVTATPTEANKYVLSSVTATYNDKSGTIKSVSRPTSGYSASDSYQIFDTLSTNTIAGLLSAISSPAVYNQYEITVTANFISIVRTISVTEVWNGKDADGSNMTITHDKAYTITDTTASKTVTGQGTYNNNFELTTTELPGYKVASITKTSGNVTVTPTINDTWGARSSATFTLSDNVAITITYTVRTYTITVTDDVTNKTGTTNPAVNTTANLVFKIGSKEVSLSSKVICVNYGNTVSISGFVTLSDQDANNQRYQLKSITDGDTSSTITTFGSAWTKTCTGENDAFTVTFTYVILQKITVNLQETSETEATNANNVLVVLQAAQDSGNSNIVILTKKGTAVEVDDAVLGGTYTIKAIIPVYVSGTVKVGSETTMNITISKGSSVDVSIAKSGSGIYSSVTYS